MKNQLRCYLKTQGKFRPGRYRERHGNGRRERHSQGRRRDLRPHKHKPVMSWLDPELLSREMRTAMISVYAEHGLAVA
jgi:hypothetical protein